MIVGKHPDFVPDLRATDNDVDNHIIPLPTGPNLYIISLSFFLIYKGSGDKGALMGDWLFWAYPWVKAVHVIAVISWMAGLFYLPRLFVYHAERGHGAEPAASFAIMEEKLLRVIMNPAMIVAWVCGLLMVATPSIIDWAAPWVWAKALGVIGMTGFHMWCAAERRRLAAGHGASGRRYRMMNEVPTLLMIVIVLAVIVRF